MRRHDLDPVSLVSGVMFAAVGLAFLSGGVHVRRLDLRWVLPALAIGAGLAILLQVVRSLRREYSD